MTNQIIHGDCFEILKSFPDNYFDAVITDPPYGINLAKWDKVVDIPIFTSKVKRLLNDGFYCFFGQMPTVINWINEAVNNKLIYREQIAWVKRLPIPSNNLQRCFENIYIYTKQKKQFYQAKGYYEDVKLPCLSTDVTTIEGIDRYIKDLWLRITRKDYDGIIKNTNSHQKEYLRLRNVLSNRSPRKVNFTNVWSFLPPSFAVKNGVKNKKHPTQKPLELIKRLVELTTKEGDIILDPFAGSGTLAIACLETNRKYVCIEKDDEYFKVMKKRISQWHNDRLNATGTHQLPEEIERINYDENSGQMSLF
jgi:site-specific DNA-methyltransferase (adenine-specific)